MILCILILSLKMPTAISTTKIGVSELRMLAKELSMFFAIAEANRKAGMRFPVMPERITTKIFFRGIFIK